jgi:predicted transcriptional regulator
MSLLRILWDLGQGSVREVLEAVNREREEPLGYTSVLKLLQIMTEKGLVIRDESDRAHVYRAAAPAERTRKALVSDLVERAFDGSARALVVQALGSGRISKRELEEIGQFVDQLRRKP